MASRSSFSIPLTRSGRRPITVDNLLKRDNAGMLMAHKLAWADTLSGGLADSKDPGDFDPEQLSLGAQTELEHTEDPHKALEIAMDHLTEHPRYYTALQEMEDELEDKEAGRKLPGDSPSAANNDPAMTGPSRAEYAQPTASLFAGKVAAARTLLFKAACAEMGRLVTSTADTSPAADSATGDREELPFALLESSPNPTTKVAFLGGCGKGSLSKGIGRPKVRVKSVLPPEASLKIAMFPTTDAPMGTSASTEQKSLAKKQVAADNKQAFGPPKIAEVMAKWAFTQSAFGPTGGPKRPRYESYLGQAPMPVAVADPNIQKLGESLRAVAAWVKRAGVPLTPQGRFAQSSMEGKPKKQAVGGPSVASVAKPIGFGGTLPGAGKNVI